MAIEAEESARTEQADVKIETPAATRTLTHGELLIAWLPTLLTPAGLRACFETALIALGFVAQWFLLPHTIINGGYDGQVRYRMMENLLIHGYLDNSRYSIYGPIFSAPLWFLSHFAQTPDYWLGRYNLILLALACCALYWLLRDHLDHTTLRIFLLLMVVASMFPNHIETYYGETFTALMVAVGLAFVMFGRRWGWGAVVLGVASAPATLAGLICVVARWMLTTRRLRLLGVVLAVGILIVLENWVRRGGPFTTGYEHDAGLQTLALFSGRSGFSYPFLFGVLSILLSFGKGIFYYMPGLLLPVRSRLMALKTGSAKTEDAARRLVTLHSLWLWFVVGLVAIYASWWAWYGGWFWGPRFFLIGCVPASFALSLWLRQRDQTLLANLITLAVLIVAVWVGMDGAVFQQTDLGTMCRANGYRYETMCFYTLDYGALTHPLILLFLFGFSQKFITDEALTLSYAIYMVYVGLVFIYLAAPLAWRIALQLREQTYRWLGVYVRRDAWRL